jgi:selenide,water dikinase
VLTELLRGVPALPAPAELLVGRETSDDAAVYRLDDGRRSSPPPISSCRSSTTRSTSAASPPPTRCRTCTRWARARCSRWPSSACRSTRCRRTPSAASCRAANAPAPMPASWWPAATASIRWNPSTAWPRSACSTRSGSRNADARAGDVLVLGKPLGVGVYSSALKKEVLDADGYRQMIASTTRLNTVGVPLAALDGVHAMTDVTGFGLLGHLLEVCRASGVAAEVDSAQIPLLPQALELLQRGCVTGASTATGPPMAPRCASPMGCRHTGSHC